jgi:hypothetical protein
MFFQDTNITAFPSRTIINHSITYQKSLMNMLITLKLNMIKYQITISDKRTGCLNQLHFPAGPETIVFSTTSKPPLESPKLPVQWVPWASSPKVKRPESETNHSASSGVEVNILMPEIMYMLSKGSVRTSQETHYVSATKPNRLMLFREIIAGYCENHTERTNTLCGQNAEFVNNFSVYFSSLSVSQSIQRSVVRWTVNNELKGIWKETALVYAE